MTNMCKSSIIYHVIAFEIIVNAMKLVRSMVECSQQIPSWRGSHQYNLVTVAFIKVCAYIYS